MSRWIDADALQDKAYKMNFDQRITERELALVNYLIGTIEKNHVFDIVRCKECRHSFINENHPQKPRICGLTKMCGTTKDDWYCADGERE